MIKFDPSSVLTKDIDAIRYFLTLSIEINIADLWASYYSEYKHPSSKKVNEHGDFNLNLENSVKKNIDDFSVEPRINRYFLFLVIKFVCSSNI